MYTVYVHAWHVGVAEAAEVAVEPRQGVAADGGRQVRPAAREEGTEHALRQTDRYTCTIYIWTWSTVHMHIRSTYTI